MKLREFVVEVKMLYRFSKKHFYTRPFLLWHLFLTASGQRFNTLIKPTLIHA
jgi:hypothetical protein